ncbi:hypothetical protein F4775DRAFT_578359 [Biscogniauxia sp. FL1348]|nr:hypothetical protein F4775DRAFT_578359 [Biscogniauxia sp. FL1348]
MDHAVPLRSVELDDDEPGYPLFLPQSSTNIPTPPSDRDSHETSSSPMSEREVQQQACRLKRPALRLRLRPTDKRKAGGSSAFSPMPHDPSPSPVTRNESQYPYSDYDASMCAAAEILLSLISAPNNTCRGPMKPSSSLQQQEGAAGYGADSTRGYFPSPDSLIHDDNPPLEQESPYDSDETESPDEGSSASMVNAVDEPHQPSDPQRYESDQAPSRRWSIRIQINQEAKNLVLDMNRLNNSSVLLKLKSEEDATWIVGVQKAKENLQIKAGGPPKSNSKEDQKQFERNYTNAWALREAQKPWPQLEQAEKFVKNMGKDIFEYPRRNREAKACLHAEGMVGDKWAPVGRTKGQLHRGTLSPPRGKARCKTTAPNASSNVYLTKKRKLNKKTSESTAEEMARQSHDPSPNQEATAVESSQQEGTRPKKRRRTEIDNLVSHLGEKWKAHVDEFGRRPARAATK